MTSERSPTTAGAANTSNRLFLPSHVVRVSRSESGGRKLTDFFATSGMPAFIDISPGGTAANTGGFSSLVSWALGFASKVIVVEGSYVARWDLQALESLSRVDAERESRKRSRIASRRLSRALLGLPGSTSGRATLMDWEDILSTSEFSEIHATLRSDVRSNASLAHAVRELALAFLARMKPQRPTVSRDPVPLLEEYVTEELAALLYFYVAQRIDVEVYPGPDLKILRDAANETHPQFPYRIPNRTHISVALSPSRVRLARPDDLPAVLSLVAQRSRHFATTAIPEVAAAFATSHAFLWDDGGAIAGFLVWSRQGNIIELQWMSVAKSASGHGIGSALVHAVVSNAASSSRVFLLTATPDSVIPGSAFDGGAYIETIRFFEHLGFRISARHDRFWGPQNHAYELERWLP